MIPTLRTERLTLRAATLADWPRCRDFYASDATRFTGGPHDARAAWTLFAGDMGHWTLHGFGWFIVDDGTGAVGFCGLHHPPHQAEPEVGWSVFPVAQGRGLATEAARAALSWAWGATDVPRIVSYIHEGNDASKAVAAKLGARGTGERAAHDPHAETWAHRRPA